MLLCDSVWKWLVQLLEYATRPKLDREACHDEGREGHSKQIIILHS